jgi:hypothetical protein
VKETIDADFMKQKVEDYHDGEQSRQLETLEKYRYAAHAEIEKIDRKVDQVKSLTNQPDKQLLVEDYGNMGKRQLTSHLESLFREIVPRHESDRAVYIARRGHEGMLIAHFHPQEWHPDPQYSDRDFIPPHRRPCASTALARTITMYPSDMASGSAGLREKFEEIYTSHPSNATHGFAGWRMPLMADYLNRELEYQNMRLNSQEGNDIRFRFQSNFTYKDLKGFMDIKDQNGNYVPVLVGVSAYEKGQKDFQTHMLVLRKEGDRYDNQGNHYIDFHVYDPYRVVRPDNKYGLERVLELTHWQGRNGVYEPGFMGDNSAIVPVLQDPNRASNWWESSYV